MFRILLLVLAVHFFQFSSGQPSITFNQVFGGFSFPVDIAFPDDNSGRFFIVEKEGIIKIIENGNILTTPFLDISSDVASDSEKGLLGLAFHPNFDQNSFFYINYVNNSNNTIISRMEVSTNSNMADVSSEKVLMQIFQPSNNHNAGDLNFHPSEGLLYIAMGDGGGGGDPECYAQDSSSYLGKILRIDVNQNLHTPPYYGIPSDNPFLTSLTVADEIWALGLRNPWRVSFDRETGDYWIADVGQADHEEISFVPNGSSGGLNFGWKVMEANDCFSTSNCIDPPPNCNSPVFTDPILELDRSDDAGGRSITGGFVYRGCKFPALTGYYICTDYITANSWVIDENFVATLIKGAPERITTFGENSQGEIYAADRNGNIYEVRDAAIPESIEISASDLPLSGTYESTGPITITTNISQGDLNGVQFITPELIISSEVSVPESISLELLNRACNQ